METPITTDAIQKAPYKELVKLASKFKVAFKNQPREKLISLLLKTGKVADNLIEIADTNNPTKAVRKKRKSNEKKKSSVKSKQTKSEKIRSLSAKGKTVLEISKIMSDTHYSFIYSVVKAIRKK